VHVSCFADDRLFTPWIKVVGPGASKVPVVEVHLRRAGEELLGVSAQVRHQVSAQVRHQVSANDRAHAYEALLRMTRCHH
jgi:hypothetical protein